MAESLGASLRRIRREQNLTQTELGDTAFSKSYVSAVENNKLLPSLEALRHFARRLGKAEDYFVLLTRQFSQDSSLQDKPVSEAEDSLFLLQRKAALFDTLFEQSDSIDHQAPDSLLSLSPDALALLSLTQQARYYFSRGLFFQKHADFPSAISAFEAALARESRPYYSAFILDELGNCYRQAGFSQTAFSYALRAHQHLVNNTALFTTSVLPFRIELHYGEACLAVSRYQQALEHFTLARQYLNSNQDLQHVGWLYRASGYCTYALTYQQAYEGSNAADQIERQYQQSLSYFLQSRTLAQMGGRKLEESHLRLMLAMVQLDLETWLKDLDSKEEKDTSLKALAQAKRASLLDDTNEQCRQALMSLHEGLKQKQEDILERKSGTFIALSSLIRVAVQRALQAYECGYESSFQRERSFATSLCQQVLDAYRDKALLEMIVWNIGNLPDPFMASPFAPLPRLPEPGNVEEPLLTSQAEVYWAAGEVAEMLGQTSHDSDFIGSCYACADSCFLRSLDGLQLGLSTRKSDASYLTRAAQRYISLLERRLGKMKEQEQDTALVASALLVLCQQHLFSSPERENAPVAVVPSTERIYE